MMLVALSGSAEQLAARDVRTPPAAAFVAVEPIQVRAVAVRGGRFRLETQDGAQIVLAGIVAPSAIGAADDAARAQLAVLALNRPAMLHHPRAEPRRDGALFGHLTVDGVWTQHALVDSGFAFAAPGRADDSGAVTLLAAETAAAKAKRGLWASRPDGPRAPLSRALERIGDFVVLRGRVRAAFRVDGDPALGLGRGRGDPYLVLRGGDAAEAEALVGVRVTARGWLADRDGPMLEIWSEAQLGR